MPTDVTPFLALVGPPNAGKTALFNSLTGASSHPINYPGSTVEYAVGTCRKVYGRNLVVADTPGIYSLSPQSPEEQVTYRFLFENPAPPKAIVAVVDGLQLSRHLPLVRQLIESGYPVVVAVTMKDLLEKEGTRLDTNKLQALLGVPVFLVKALGDPVLEKLVAQVQQARTPAQPKPPAPWSAKRQQAELKWASEIAGQVLSGAPAGKRLFRSILSRTEFLDHVLLHPVWGLVLFALIMSGLFTSIFWCAAPAMKWVTHLFETLAAVILERWPHSLVADFFASGVALSLGAILTFVPQIMILFLGITLLEDSGYLARAATLIDRPLSRLGLNGRSFVPLLSGYACAIPAMLAARTIPNRRERFATLFIIPLMSCSARLPVYSLLLAFVFWGQPSWKPGIALALIYLLSLLIGSIMAWLLQRFLPADEGSFFMMELPLYRRPSLRAVFKTVALRTESYLRKAGPAIFVFAITLWVARTFPHYEAPTPGETLQTSYAAQAGRFIDPLMHPMGGDWRTGVALLSAFAAREVFVSSLGLVLQVSESSEDQRQVSLLQSMRQATRSDGTPLFTTASVIGLVIFFMIALQCMSTVAVAHREFGNWKYPLIQLVGFNLLAYGLAVGAVQTLRFFGVA